MAAYFDIIITKINTIITTKLIVHKQYFLGKTLITQRKKTHS